MDDGATAEVALTGNGGIVGVALFLGGGTTPNRAQALITQISQTAVCNRLHAVEKRLCRWLLLSHDLVESDELAMTQEFISNMLGGRRESVTIAAARLQDAGPVRYSRGHINDCQRGRASRRQSANAIGSCWASSTGCSVRASRAKPGFQAGGCRGSGSSARSTG